MNIIAEMNLTEGTRKLMFWKDKQNWQLLSSINQGNVKKPQINKIRYKKGDITTDAARIKRAIRNYYEQLFTNELGNQEEINKLLDTYNLLRINHEGKENLNRPVATKEI